MPAHPHHRGCPGFRSASRRSALQAGLCGGLGLSLSDLLRLQAEDKSGISVTAGKKLEARAKSIIQINLPGGFPHHESFDPKPEALSG
jgi:hypothetical protein